MRTPNHFLGDFAFRLEDTISRPFNIGYHIHHTQGALLPSMSLIRFPFHSASPNRITTAHTNLFLENIPMVKCSVFLSKGFSFYWNLISVKIETLRQKNRTLNHGYIFFWVSLSKWHVSGELRTNRLWFGDIWETKDENFGLLLGTLSYHFQIGHSYRTINF